MKILFALFVAAFMAGCSQIDSGNVGVERTLGKVSEQALPPGIYMTVFKSVDEFTTKEISFQLQDMNPKSKDNLTMQDVDVDIYFKVAPEAVPKLFTKYQGDVMRHNQIVKDGTSDLVVGFNRVLRESRESVYNSIAAFDATTMHTKRTDLAETIRTTLQKELDANDKGAFIVTAVNVRNLVTDKNIEAAIRSKAETDQKIAQAMKEVELARAEAEKKRVAAEGDARANRILAESITPQLLRLREIEAQQAIATKNGNTTILLPTGAQPLVQVK